MQSPDDRVVRGFRGEYGERRDELVEFDGLMDRHAVKEPARSALHAWVEEHLIGPVLDLYERKIRGAQGRN